MSEEIKVELLKPLIDVTAEEEEKITELVFKEPTIKDFLKYKMPDLLQDIKAIVEITAKLTGNRVQLIETMDPKDYSKCLEVIAGFFADSQAI